MNFLEKLNNLKGYLEIIVTDHKTGEILRHDKGHNQVQDWARHAIVYLMAGRPFCTWGNHGEDIEGTPMPHFKDGKDGTGSGDIILSSPWVYSSAFDGLIQLRTVDGDQLGGTATSGASLYPFFPTKMRFGTGGLLSDQNPRTDIPTDQTHLNVVDATFPYMVIDRQRVVDGHIQMTESGSIDAINGTIFSCKLPGGDTSETFPYDNKVISEAGLFCDAGLIPTGTVDTNMRAGILLCYRTFYGITKHPGIDVVFNWEIRS